jgi:RAT1-interacting protein
MTAPFEQRDEEKWEMTAIALDGSVYVELHDPPEIRKERHNRQSAHAIQSYMGYSYESFSTVGAPDQVEEKFDGQHEAWSGDVNTNIQVSLSVPGIVESDPIVVQVGQLSPFTSMLSESLVRSAIGDIPLFLGGEVDCVDGSLFVYMVMSVADGAAEPGSPHPGLEGCVELKTNMLIRNERQQKTFER